MGEMSYLPEMMPTTSRRNFLVASATGLAGVAAGSRVLPAAESSSGAATARSTILFFLCGGISHIDTWDMKPEAPAEYRGEFKPIATSAPGITLCEHLPLLAKQAHHIALVNSINGTVNTNDHHAGYYHNLTGHVPDVTFLSLGNNRTPFPDDWPMGCIVAAKTPQQAAPSAITLPGSRVRNYTRPGQFAGSSACNTIPPVLGDQKSDAIPRGSVLSSDVPSRRLFATRTSGGIRCCASTSFREFAHGRREGGRCRCCRHQPRCSVRRRVGVAGSDRSLRALINGTACRRRDLAGCRSSPSSVGGRAVSKKYRRRRMGHATISAA
jgi:hypothetical protein